MGGYALKMLNKHELDELYKQCVFYWGFERQAHMLQEECAELIVAVSHYLRNRDSSLHEVIEEIADAQLMINQMVSYLGRAAVDQMIDVKSDKIKKKLEKYRLNDKK